MHAHLTAKFLSEARAALVRDLGRTPDTAIFLHGRAAQAGGLSGPPPPPSSYNWAGYADVSTTAGTFTNVGGSWTVPAADLHIEERFTSDWVGLDGFSTATVEQDGTASQCFQGVPLYYSWYEMYPAGDRRGRRLGPARRRHQRLSGPQRRRLTPSSPDRLHPPS